MKNKYYILFLLTMFSLWLYKEPKTELEERTIASMGSFLRVETESKYSSDIQKVFNLIKKIDNILSSYKKNSEISLLNKNKNINKASAMTVSILKKSLIFYKESFGLFDISLGSINTEFYKMPFWRKEKRNNLITKINAQLKIYKNNQNITLPKKITIKNNTILISDSTKLDLGGIGKGFAIEEASKILNKDSQHSIIQLSGDIFCLHKCKFNIRTPIKGSKKILIKLQSNIQRLSISTSGTYEKQLNNKIHHIINPITTLPSTFFKSVSLIAKNANTRLDALATGIAAGSLKNAKKILKGKKIGSFLIHNKVIYINSYFFKLVTVLDWLRLKKDFKIIILDKK